MNTIDGLLIGAIGVALVVLGLTGRARDAWGALIGEQVGTKIKGEPKPEIRSRENTRR